jgi:hypothetical protein
MYTIEITLKANPLGLTVQRKDKETADALFATLLAALQTGTPTILELHCDRQVEKKLAVVTSEVMAVQLMDKASASSGLGTRAGFGLG